MLMSRLRTHRHTDGNVKVEQYSTEAESAISKSKKNILSWTLQWAVFYSADRGRGETLKLLEPNTWGFRKPEGINRASRTSEYNFCPNCALIIRDQPDDYDLPVRVWFSGEAVLCPRQYIITVITAGPRFWADLAISTNRIPPEIRIHPGYLI